MARKKRTAKGKQARKGKTAAGQRKRKKVAQEVLEARAAQRGDEGLYRGLARAVYDSIPAANSSLLKLYAKTAAHARQAMDEPEDSTAPQQLGDAAHAACLEPARLERDFGLAPTETKRSAAGRAVWARWRHDNPGVLPLKEGEWDACRRMRDAVWAHPVASRMLQESIAQRNNEATLVWVDERTGMLCKGRPDALASFNMAGALADVKTTRNAAPRAFERQAADLQYHVQAAFYMDGLQQLVPWTGERKYIYIIVESSAPWCVAVRELVQPALEQGRYEYEQYLTAHADALETQTWPGYPAAVQPMHLPRWAMTTEEWVRE